MQEETDSVDLDKTAPRLDHSLVKICTICHSACNSGGITLLLSHLVDEVHYSRVSAVQIVWSFIVHYVTIHFCACFVFANDIFVG